VGSDTKSDDRVAPFDEAAVGRDVARLIGVESVGNEDAKIYRLAPFQGGEQGLIVRQEGAALELVCGAGFSQARPR
jgi:hypothetical protein